MRDGNTEKINRDSSSRGTLIKVLGRTDIVAMGIGTMIGWSWIIIAASWITGAGFLGALLAFIVGGAVILAIGTIYGELTAALPITGGEYVFAYRAMGRMPGFITGWIMAMAYIGVAAWEGIAFATAINFIFPVPKLWPLWEIAGYQVYLSWALVGMAGALAMMIINLLGVKPAVLFQVMATAAIISLVLIIFFGGITFGNIENTGTLFTTGKGFFYVLFMVPAMLIGFDVIPQSAEELNIHSKDIGRMIMVCIVLSIAWYCILIIGVGLAAPEEIRVSGILPIANIAAYLFNGDVFAAVIVFGGILGILTTWNGFFMASSRLLFAMGRANTIPRAFGKTYGKAKVPVVATLVVGTTCMIAPFLGRNALIWLVDISSLCALFAYGMVALSFIILRKTEPSLERPFNGGGIYFGVAIFIATVLYFVLYLANIATEMALAGISIEIIILIVWVILGTILYGYSEYERKDLSPEREEYLVFGRHYMRKRGDSNEH